MEGMYIVYPEEALKVDYVQHIWVYLVESL